MRKVGMVLLLSCLFVIGLFLRGGEKKNAIQIERRQNYAPIARR
jgi:hypothetical protein